MAEEVIVNIYNEADEALSLETFQMTPHKNRIWELHLQGNYLGKYYTFQTKHYGRFLGETPGIYAQAVGVNGKRAAIIDLNTTNPAGWHEHIRPQLQSVNDIVLYELHIRDFTVHPESGSSFPGKFMGLVEEGTHTARGTPTGIEHLKELDITHVHILPSFDYRSIDEARLHVPQYNWGYDPDNYNVPEGSYASDPAKPLARIREFKEMVMQFHKNGIQVIMDMVYNHTGKTEDSNFNLEAPGYYYRKTPKGKWSNASGCGNETASERIMMRKFIIESCKHWVNEYKVDGFRFDLMGIHDIETMNQLSSEMKKIDDSLFIYGEGWTAGESPLPEEMRAIKLNTAKLTHIAVFSDDIRDAIKGCVFHVKDLGFVNGGHQREETIKFGVVGSTPHPQVDCSKTSSHVFWANSPCQCISYVSCHDNHTLFDKLDISCSHSPATHIKKMHCLANAIVLTSQGIPFLHAGVEMMRSKHGEHNTYNLPDSINQINWTLKETHADVFNYYKSLIGLRRLHPAFKMSSTEMIVQHLKFFDTDRPGFVAFQIQNHANNDSWENILVIYNAQQQNTDFILPNGHWQIAALGNKISLTGTGSASGNIIVPEISMAVLFQK